MTERRLPQWYRNAVAADADVFAGTPQWVDKSRPHVPVAPTGGQGVQSQRRGEVAPRHTGVTPSPATGTSQNSAERPRVDTTLGVFDGAPETVDKSIPYVNDGGYGRGVSAQRRGAASRIHAPSQSPAASQNSAERSDVPENADGDGARSGRPREFRRLPQWYLDAVAVNADVFADAPERPLLTRPHVPRGDRGQGVQSGRKGKAPTFGAPSAERPKRTRENNVISNQQSVREIVSPIVRYGGKARAAPLVWQAIGDPHCFVDPFAGSLAVPLRAPQPLRKVVINDVDDLLVNFWRALQNDPGGVAYWADYPTSHTDLIARREWLRQKWPDVRRAMKADAEWYDVKIAGWYVWAVSNSIDLLRLEFPSADSQSWHTATSATLTALATAATVERDGGDWDVPENGVHPLPLNVVFDVPENADAAAGIADDRLFPTSPTPFTGERLTPWLSDLARKIQRWIILCKDWRDVASSRSITSTTGSQPSTICGIFLDPPYNRNSVARGKLYSAEDFDVADDVFDWLTTPDSRYGGDDVDWTPWENPQFRIVLCGYENDYRTRELPGARVIRWKRGGGMERAGDVDGVERNEILVLSPACLPVNGDYVDVPENAADAAAGTSQGAPTATQPLLPL